ncbi:DMT family transporter [Phaeovulum sp.]|uniref:DMT family transporter n=1 Tax=Phaeovulum sp. TaxID=2934796 RepID=UPI0039E259C1
MSQQQRPAQTDMSAHAWVLLAVLALIWGGSFLSNRAAVAEVPVASLVAMRVTGGCILLWLWVMLRRLPLPRGRKIWWRFLVMGALNNAIPFSLIVWGQKHIDSGLAGVLNASTAIFGVLVAAWVFTDERLTPRKALGVLIGFVGVVVAIGPATLLHFDPGSTGQLAILGAAFFYALAGAYARVQVRGLVPEVAAAGMLTGASVLMLPTALLLDGVPSFDWSTPVWVAVLWLAVGCTALAYLLYYRVLALAGAGNLSLVTLLIPPVAIVAGWAVYDETLPLRAFLGFGILALGLLVLNGQLRLPFRFPLRTNNP